MLFSVVGLQSQILNTIKMKNLFVFDVESTSLHGTGFAVGAIVMALSNGAWSKVEDFELKSLESEVKCVDWVKENVLPHLQDMPSVTTDKELRDKFYEFYMRHKESCDVYSDVNFPVETNFLSAVVADDLEARQWNMPYPLLDIANIVDISVDRAEKCQKDTGIVLKKHNPLHDAIASAYCLTNSLL